MDENGAGGCIIGALMLLLNAGAIIGSGLLAWEWIEPDTFWTVVLFIIVWSVIGKLAYALVGIIMAGIASLFQ